MCLAKQKKQHFDIPSERILTDFWPVLRSFSPYEIDNEQATVYGVTRDLRLAYVNKGWMRFARSVHAPGDLTSGSLLGKPVLERMSDNLRPHYRRLFERAGQYAQGQRRPLTHYYECPSAHIYRKFGMLIYADRDDRGYLVLHSPVMSCEFSAGFPDLHAGEVDAYVQSTGAIVQCSHCRRTRSVQDENSWVWVPELIERHDARLTHSLCQPCVSAFWGAAT